MTGLGAAIAQRGATAAPRIAVGVVEGGEGSKAKVNVEGRALPARWADPLVVRPGDVVLVLLSPGIRGQGGATVICKTSDRPRVPEGTVSSIPGGSQINVTVDGETKSCRYLTGYTPVVGDLVSLTWHGGTPFVMGKSSGSASTTAVASTGVSDPAPSSSSGVDRFPATSSGTWSHSVGGWSSYYGSDLMQGTWAGKSYSGAWFYGSAPKSKLEGKKVSKVLVKYGSRKYAGNYNDPLVLNLYRHTQTSMGSSEPPRTHGPQGVTLAVNAGPGWVELPISWGQAIVDDGGGISISGGSYGGVSGRGAEAESGLLEIHWSN